jgi:hypothetical protein
MVRSASDESDVALSTGTELDPLRVWRPSRRRCLDLGSDDFPKEAKVPTIRDLNAALQAGGLDLKLGERIPLAEFARAHETSGAAGASLARGGDGVSWITQSDEAIRPLP